MDKPLNVQYEGHHDLFTVFTGLWARLPRGNVEKENWENIIDPMDMWPTWQDRYPKVDLQGRHFEDLHPLSARQV